MPEGSPRNEDTRTAQRDVEVVSYETAIASAGQAYAEGMAEQLARSPREAAIAAIGRSATPEQIDAWITRFRPHTTSGSPRRPA